MPSETISPIGRPVAAITHRDAGYEAQMPRDELLGRQGVFMLAPTLGEHIFFLRLQHREFANFGQITRQSIFAGDDWQGVRHNSSSSGVPW